MFSKSASMWPAPAKLNLFLHITGKRDDGYHELQTVFQFLDYGDELNIDVREDGAIHRIGGVADIPEEDDLTVRAARLLQEHIVASGQPVNKGADIHVTKRLPMGGGLGGGSSDAATVLVALNHLWECGLGRDELMTLGLCLGADVPVFINGVAAWAEGIGERLTSVELPQPWFLFVKPPVEVSTAEIFGAAELTRNCSPITICDFVSDGVSDNVCEPVVSRRYPQVAQVLEWLSSAASAHQTGAEARLTGTGSCVFAAFDEQVDAEHALAEMPQSYQGFVARGLNRSPLLNKVQD